MRYIPKKYRINRPPPDPVTVRISQVLATTDFQRALDAVADYFYLGYSGAENVTKRLIVAGHPARELLKKGGVERAITSTRLRRP